MRFHLRQRARRDTRPRLARGEVAWIAENRLPFGDYAVGSLVPVVFERCARILHPAWAPTREPLRWDLVAAWSGRTIHALAQWEDLSGPVPGWTSRDRSWRRRTRVGCRT